MYLRLSIQGAMSGGEVWSVNPAFHFNAALAPTWDQESADAIVAALVAGVTASTIPPELRTLMSSSATFTGYRLEGRDEDESLLGVAEAFYTTPIAGTGTQSKVNQSALVLSLRTILPGARGRGRMYWPALGATITPGTGKLSAPTPAILALATTVLLHLIEDIIRDNAGLFPWTEVLTGVRSQTDHVTRTVTRVQVGDVLDTQRRRRDMLAETYASVDM